MPKRAAIYLRISEDRTQEGLGVDRQREDCAALIASRGWERVGEYVDNDITASGRKRRPAFEQLIADVNSGQVDVIVAWALDRLVRAPRARLALVEACRSNEVSVALVRGSDIDLTTAAGRLFAGLLGEVAQHEIDAKSERQRRQSRQAAEKGLPGGGHRAFGYAAGGRVVDAAEAMVVREMYTRFLAGAGLGELTDWLNREGWRTARGSRWRASTVRVVLANPRNAGLRGTRPVVNETSGLRSQWHTIVGPAMWPAIVDEPTWRAAMQILQDPARRVNRNRNAGGAVPRSLLAGIATCGRCGLHMISGSSGYGKRRSYRCSGKMHISRDGLLLDDYVQVSLLRRLGEPDAVDLLEAPPDIDVAALQNEAVVTRAQLNGLARDYVDQVLDREQVREAGDRLRSQLAKIEFDIARAGQVDVVAPLVLADGEGERLKVWQSYPSTTQRAVIARLMRVVVLRGRPGRPPPGMPFDPSTVRIEWVRGA